MQRLKDSGANKRLNLVYLANGIAFRAMKGFLSLISSIEVAQQSKARRKDDFLLAFSPVRSSSTH